MLDPKAELRFRLFFAHAFSVSSRCEGAARDSPFSAEPAATMVAFVGTTLRQPLPPSVTAGAHSARQRLGTAFERTELSPDIP